MQNLPDSLGDEFQNYEVTVEPGHLTLIVSTTDGNLNTYTFSTDERGRLHLQSQTQNGSQVSGDLPTSVVTLLQEHPVLDAAEIDVD